MSSFFSLLVNGTYNVVAQIPLSVTVGDTGDFSFFFFADERIRVLELELLLGAIL